jgi:hypothetical protein
VNVLGQKRPVLRKIKELAVSGSPLVAKPTLVTRKSWVGQPGMLNAKVASAAFGQKAFVVLSIDTGPCFTQVRQTVKRKERNILRREEFDNFPNRSLFRGAANGRSAKMGNGKWPVGSTFGA